MCRKAYQDQETERNFTEQGVIICTPDKKKKNQEVYEVGQVDSGHGLFRQFGNR
jgi:hypothetical protein